LVGDEDAFKFKGFTQHTGKPTPFPPQNSNVRLRHQAISFVSSGNIQPQVEPEEEESSDGTGDDEEDGGAIQTNIMDADVEHTEDGMANMNLGASEMDVDVDDTTTASAETRIIVDAPTEEPAPTLQFVIDTVGDPTLATSSTSSKPGVKRSGRAASPARSDTSEEVITFKGRNKVKTVNDPFFSPSTPNSRSAQHVRSSPHPTDDLLKALNGEGPSHAPSKPSHVPSKPSHAPSKPSHAPSTNPVVPGPTAAKGWASAPSPFDTNPASGQWEAAPARPYWKKGKPQPRPDLNPSESDVKAFETSSARTSKVQFAEPESTIPLVTSSTKKSPSNKNRRGKRGRKKDNRVMRAAIVSEDDSAGEAAYDDYMQNLLSQLEKEDGKAGEENIAVHPPVNVALAGPSLVVDGKEIGVDEVLPRHTREIELADDVNQGWETDSSSMNPDMDELSSVDSEDESEFERELEYNEREQWEDEEDLRQRRLERMTDEQMARLLFKQQEFGISGDELLIDDGVGDVDAARAGLSSITNSNPELGRPTTAGPQRRAGRDSKNNFVDASLLAQMIDQYGETGFDIMDFERPSLRLSKKGRKGRPPAELEMLSDEDLKEEMQGAWEKDRAKKRQKKLEREELRRDGLLGSAGRKGKSDLKAKYPWGMDLRSIHDELRDFLQTEDLLERAFPPMDKTDRKALHEICVALNLGSRSQGSGKKRFPIVFKTSRTGDYSEDIFAQIVHASSKGFLSNRAKANKFAKKSGKGPGRGGGFDKAATGLRNGEVVGAGAAEISHTSFGARMMAKHGWTKGMGLGKDGEGRTVPVEQVMRIGTHGLG
jgi:hypothetical protein